jgi:arylsulfatase A-like enzyme
MSDDMNDWTSLTNNWVKTPNLKAFAETGVQFERAHVPAQECNPSRTAILLGQRPGTTGMYWNRHEFRMNPSTMDAVTLPQFFKAEGYETLDTGKIYHQRTETWDLSGPGGGAAVPAPLQANPWHKGDFLAKGDTYNEEAFVFGPSDQPEAQIGDTQSAQYTADYVKVAHAKPFFAACGFVKPHTPLIAPQRYFDMYPLNEIQLPPVVANDLDDVGPIARTVANNFGKNIQETVLKFNAWPQAVQAYKAAASFVDNNLGIVVRALDSGPNKENTIVIFVSDHGVHAGTKEHWWKMTLWNETTRIPFVLRVPGVSVAGGVSPRTVNAIDIYATLLDVMNYPAKADLDGRSIAPLLRDPKAAWEYPTMTTAGYKNHSIVSEKFRFTQYADGFQELYDQEADPNEFTNVATDPKHAAVIAELAKWLPKTDAPDLLKQ